jgi:hypothetical protein
MGNERGPIGGRKRIDENKAADFGGMERGVVANEESAERVTDQNVGLGYAGFFEKMVEFGGEAVEGSRLSGKAAPAETGAVVAVYASKGTDAVLNRFPA